MQLQKILRRPTDFMGIGCIAEIIIFLSLAIFLNTDKLTDIVAYAVILAVPAAIIRYLLWSNNMLNSMIARILGPCIFCVAILLAFVKPITTEDKPTEEPTKVVAQKANPDKKTDKKAVKNDAAAPHWEKEPPAGVSYHPADENISLEEALAE